MEQSQPTKETTMPKRDRKIFQTVLPAFRALMQTFDGRHVSEVTKTLLDSLCATINLIEEISQQE